MSGSRASRVTEVATSQHNLPAALSTFVGRDNELRETRRLLGATRVLTLIGAGGVGKTRLAVHLGAAVLDAYPDGVWLVDLTPVAHPRRVARAVAGVLGYTNRRHAPRATRGGRVAGQPGVADPGQLRARPGGVC